MEKILQIIPANGWCALYKNGTEMPSEEPLVCFALVEDDNKERHIRGMGCDYVSIDFVDFPSNFVGYKNCSKA